MNISRILNSYNLRIKNLVERHSNNDDLLQSYSNTIIFWAVVDNHPDIIQLLIDKNVNLQHNNWRNESAFFVACLKKNIECAKLLYSSSAINQVNRLGSTPFLSSCYNNDAEIVEFLLSKNELDVNCTDRYGNHGLLIACQFGYFNIIDMILKYRYKDKQMIYKMFWKSKLFEPNLIDMIFSYLPENVDIYLINDAGCGCFVYPGFKEILDRHQKLKLN